MAERCPLTLNTSTTIFYPYFSFSAKAKALSERDCLQLNIRDDAAQQRSGFQNLVGEAKVLAHTEQDRSHSRQPSAAHTQSGSRDSSKNGRAYRWCRGRHRERPHIDVRSYLQK